MQTKHIALATLLATAFAGSAFAFPASGEGPLFQNDDAAATMVSRQAVRQDAISSPPVAGFSSDFGMTGDMHGSLSRAQVRQETRDAITHGYLVKSGEMS